MGALGMMPERSEPAHLLVLVGVTILGSCVLTLRRAMNRRQDKERYLVIRQGVCSLFRPKRDAVVFEQEAVRGCSRRNEEFGYSVIVTLNTGRRLIFDQALWGIPGIQAVEAYFSALARSNLGLQPASPKREKIIF